MSKLTVQDLLQAEKMLYECPKGPTRLIGTRLYLEKVLQLTPEQIASGQAYGREIIVLEGPCKLEQENERN